MNDRPLSSSAAVATQLQQAMALHQRGRLMEAKAVYEEVLRTQPRNFDALYLLGTLSAQLGDPQGAVKLIEQSIVINSGFAASHNNRGLALSLLKRLDEALTSYDRALAIDPDYAEAHNNRGNALSSLERLDEALASYDRALAIKPDYADAHNNRGHALLRLDRPAEALASCGRALAIDPGFAEAHNNCGNALSNLKRLDDALASYDRALFINPNYAEAHNNRGMTLRALKRRGQALASFDRALAIKADYAEAHNNRGIALVGLKRPAEALTSFDRALAIKVDYAEAYNNQGIALLELNRPHEALSSCERALTIKADVKAYVNQGNALSSLKRLDDALTSYTRALALDVHDNHEWLLGLVLHASIRVCQWSNLDQQAETLRLAIAASERVCAPFTAMTLYDDPALHLQVARSYLDEWCVVSQHVALAKTARRDKIRVGYYSADFHNHATCHLMAGLFEAQDKSRFEWFAFSFGPDTQDTMRERVIAAFDQFHDVRSLSDEQVAQMSRRLGIDIAVDLKGFTQDCRPGIFAHRCAPLQVSYLGYPGSMGAAFMDYLIADAVVIAPEQRQHYSEKIVYLPDSYQVNDSSRKISTRIFTRQELGLPESGFVFCCFNNNYKISPQVFDVWMKLLQAVPSSVLWLLQDNPTAANNLRAQARARGVEASRLVFAPRMPLPDHLSRHRLADLFLDTLPCNAHTTASDALWAGLPVLTCAGQSFAARVAASLLTAVGLPELITHSLQEYQELALALATSPERLGRTRKKLKDQLSSAALFNTPRFARHLESAYLTMYDRYQKDLPPHDFAVNAADTPGHQGPVPLS